MIGFITVTETVSVMGAALDPPRLRTIAVDHIVSFYPQLYAGTKITMSDGATIGCDETHARILDMLEVLFRQEHQ